MSESGDKSVSFKENFAYVLNVWHQRKYLQPINQSPKVKPLKLILENHSKCFVWSTIF